MSEAARRGGWRVGHRTGAAAELHAAWPSVEEEPERRALALCRPRSAALVLGSTQPDALVDRAAADALGVEIARRRSGGGAVLVGPGDPVWVDVWVPSGDTLFEDDVGRAFLWLGEAWATALDRLGVAGTTVVGGPSRPPADPAVAASCFGSASWGEVLVPDGRKVVGLSQRRVRAGAQFHTACLVTWDPGSLLELLAVSAAARRRAQDELSASAVGLAEVLGVETAPLFERAAAALVDTLT